MNKTDYTFRMNVMEEIFEIRSCIEILANDIKVNTADDWVYALQLTENCKVYILEDLHPSGGKTVLNMFWCDRIIYVHNGGQCTKPPQTIRPCPWLLIWHVFLSMPFYQLLHRQMPGVDCICSTPYLEQSAASCQRITDIKYIQQHF